MVRERLVQMLCYCSYAGECSCGTVSVTHVGVTGLYRTRACLFAVLESARCMLDINYAIQQYYRETKKMPNEVLICP